MEWLGFNVIRRMTNEAIGVGNHLSLAGLEEHGIGGQRNNLKKICLLSRLGYLLRTQEYSSCRDRDKEEK